MYKFDFTYSDNKTKSFDHINEVHYLMLGENIIIKNDDILSHKFPTVQEMHLYGENSNHTVFCKNLISISVSKEEN